MFESNKVVQSDINATKVVGRDDNSTNHSHFYNRAVIYREDLVLKRLLDEHELEKEKDSEYQRFSDDLNSFFKNKQVENLRDLRAKLKDGDRESLIDFAMESKERVTKKILKFALYKSAQDVYTYLLTNIRAAFKHSVENRIKSGRFQAYEIDDFVKHEIIEPFFQSVQGSSLYIDIDELYGILYLLTGNCYIEWD